MPRPETTMPTPQQIAAVARYAERLEGLGHGEKGGIVAEACAELGVKPATFYRWLAPHTVAARKRRSDAGALALTEEEARAIAAYLTEATRAQGKQLPDVGQAVADLRANGLIRAERVDAATGEVFVLSDSTVLRALRHYGLHPDQAKRPAPHVRLKTEHPNHLWQVDASVCVVFYLPDGGAAIVELDEAVHYKNKPGNLKAIERFRVIRYVLTDHASGVIRWRYYPHSETGEHTVRFLAWCMARPRPRTDPFHGAPRALMSDPGATSARLVKRFCKRLDIHLQVNKPKNPRAKGQVEQGQNLVERVFEGRLKFVRDKVTSIEALNAMAEPFQIHFNATAVHTRHKETRFASWCRITQQQLRIAPSEAVLLALATEEPESRRVSGELTVSFRGRTWNVRDVPGAEAGARLMVHWHPFVAGGAMAVIEDTDGRELHVELAEVTRDEFGYPSTAVPYGEFHGLADDRIERNRKIVARVASGEAGIEAAEKKRADKNYVPFGGRVNSFKSVEEAELPAWMPKRGTQLMEADTVRVELTPLNHVESASRLRALVADWGAEHYRRLVAGWPDGVMEADIEQVAAVLRDQDTHQAPKLAAVK